jgi:hypothetical protein
MLTEPFSILAIALGVIAAAVLFALHLLHVRPPQQRVATLLFWRQAVRQQRRRVIWGRFSHPWVYALLSLIALLICASLLFEHWKGTANQDLLVVVVDSGYSMTATDAQGRRRIDEAIRQVTDDLSQRNGQRIALISAGPQPALLSDEQAPPALLRRQLAQLQAADLPAASADALTLAANLLADRQGQIVWYTDQNIAPPQVPPEVSSRVTIRRIGADEPNANIAAVLFEPASEDATTGALRVRIQSSGGYSGPVTLTATPAAGGSPKATQGNVGGESDLVLDGFAADGSTWDLAISGAPGPKADDQVRLRLPHRLPLRFRFAGDVPRPLRAALLAVGTEAGDGEPAIMVSNAAAPAGSADLARIRIVETGPAASPAPLELQSGVITVDDLELEGAIAGAGPALSNLPVDQKTIVRAGPAVLASINVSETGRTLDFSTALCDGDLPRRAAFPILLQRLCRVLIGWTDAAPAVAAERVVADPLWPGGSEVLQQNRPVVVFQRLAGPSGEPVASSVAKAQGGQAHPPYAISTWFRPWELALIAAMALLIVEGLLYAARKIV